MTDESINKGVLKSCESCRPSRPVLVVTVIYVLLTFCVAIAWIQSQRISAEIDRKLENTKVARAGISQPSATTSVNSVDLTKDLREWNSSQSEMRSEMQKPADPNPARPGSENTPRTCPNFSSNFHHHDDVTLSSKMPSLCRNQNKVVVYSKLVNNFSAARFREYQKSVVDCKLPDGVTCLYTEDDSLYSTADVLYIHECFSRCQTPAHSEQIIVRYNLGPELDFRPCNNGTIHAADIKVNYHISSTIPWLYLCLSGIKQPVMDALRLGVPSNRHGIAMFVSDCTNSFSQWRYEYLQELMKYVEIDSYGKCLHNTPMKPAARNSKRYNLKLDIIKEKRYKFLIVFENSQVSEYVTEKIWHAYMTQAIPIYYGAPEVYNQVPGRNTFIDAAKFPRPKQLAEYIKEVDGNRRLYRSFFDFDISNFAKFENRWCSKIPLSCQICNRAYEIKQSRCNMQN